MESILLWVKEHNVVLILAGTTLVALPLLVYFIIFVVGIGYKVNNWRWTKHLAALKIKNECVTVDLGIQAKQGAQNEPKLREEIKKLLAEMQQRETTISEIRALLDAQKENLGSRDRRIRSLEGTLANGKEAYQTLHATHEENLKNTANLEQELSASLTSVKTITGELEAALPLAAEAEQLRKHVKHVEDELLLLRTDNLALQAAGSMLERQLAAREQEVKMMGASLADTNNKRDILVERIKGLEAENLLYRSQHEAQVARSLNAS